MIKQQPKYKSTFWRNAQKKFRKLFLLPQIREYPLSKPIDIWVSEQTNLRNYSFFNQADYDEFKTNPKDEFHDFSWLADLYKKAGHSSKGQVQKYTSEWLNRFSQYHPIVWDLPVLAKRIQNWVIYFDLVFDDKNEIYQQKFFKALNDQIYELYFRLDICQDDLTRIRALRTLISVSVSFLSFRKYLKKFLSSLQREISLQFFKDGTHKLRNPNLDLEYLKIFLEIRATLYAGHQEVPPYLHKAIQNSVNVIHFSRHHDGGLYIMNGSNEDHPRFIDYVIKQAHIQPQKLPSKLENGILKLKANQVTLFMDCGDRYDYEYNTGHASPLSFELSIGRTRIITNCGYSHQKAYEQWQPSLRSSAAHSTLTIQNESPDLPYDVSHFLSEQQGHIFLRAQHNGYMKKFGINHQRHIYLNPEGDNIIGEDILEGVTDQFLDLRFHLHPLILCSKLPKKNQLLLRLPDGSGWRFIGSAEQLSLQESVYFGYQEQKKRSDQIVIAVQPNGSEQKKLIIRWCLQKIQ